MNRFLDYGPQNIHGWNCLCFLAVGYWETCVVVRKSATTVRWNVFLWMLHPSLTPTLLADLYIDAHLHTDTPMPLHRFKETLDLSATITPHHVSTCISFMYFLPPFLLIIFTLALLCVQPLPQVLPPPTLFFLPPAPPITPLNTSNLNLPFLLFVFLCHLFFDKKKLSTHSTLIHIFCLYCLVFTCGNPVNRMKDWYKWRVCVGSMCAFVFLQWKWRRRRYYVCQPFFYVTQRLRPMCSWSRSQVVDEPVNSCLMGGYSNRRH